jgi:hypothetical protein
MMQALSGMIMAKQTTTYSFPALLRVTSRATPLDKLLSEAITAGLPIVLPGESGSGEIEDASASDPSLTTEALTTSPPPPQPGTSYAGLTPAQRYAFIVWSRKPENPAPAAFQQIYLANLEARLLEITYRQTAIEKLIELGTAATWANNLALHRTYLLSCWLQQDGPRLVDWINTRRMPADLLGVALGLQALIGVPLTAPELGTVIATWQLGVRLPTDLLKLRLDSLTAILGRAPLVYGLSQLDTDATAPRPWRTSHRGLRLLIPQPNLRPLLEPSLRDLLAVADVSEDEEIPIGTLASLDTSQPTTPSPEQPDQPSLEELGWRLILEFGSNRSEYFDYVLIQAQKLSGYSQIMDEDRRIVYRIIFRKSEMRRFWRLWDYVHGWTSTRVYLNGEELEKWKVWPYSQYLQ